MFNLATMPKKPTELYQTAARLEQQWCIGRTYDGRNTQSKPTYKPYQSTPKRDPDAMDINAMTAEERTQHYCEG